MARGNIGNLGKYAHPKGGHPALAKSAPKAAPKSAPAKRPAVPQAPIPPAVRTTATNQQSYAQLNENMPQPAFGRPMLPHYFLQPPQNAPMTTNDLKSKFSSAVPSKFRGGKKKK